MSSQNTSTNKFHITVGTTPQSSGRLNLESELRLLKTALLYADEVKFCSVSSSFLIMLLQFGQLSGEDMLKVYAQSRPILGKAFEDYKRLKSKKRRNRQELLALKKFRATLDKALANAKKEIEDLVLEAGLGHLETAFNTGILEIQIFEDIDTKILTKQYFDTVSDAVLSGQTYPLFDKLTGELVDYAIKEGRIQPPTVSVNRSKQVGLSSDLLQRLPLFDNASMDQIIDIRKELDQPLRRFRSAIIKFSRDVESAAWEKEFPQEAEQVFREHVEPAVLDIEEECKSNRLLRSLLPSLVDKPVSMATTSALGVLLAAASQLPPIVTAGLGLTAGVTTVTLRTVQDWYEKKQTIEGNQLYFYYKTGKLLTD
jgi:hypothetical protein